MNGKGLIVHEALHVGGPKITKSYNFGAYNFQNDRKVEI
jgi:hypothetical protein